MIVLTNLYVLTKEEGGRMSPIFQDYRANLWFPNAPTSSDSFLKLEEEEMLVGGKSYRGVKFKLIHPEFVYEYLHVGTQFEVKEGFRVIAKGVIVDIDKTSLHGMF